MGKIQKLLLLLVGIYRWTLSPAKNALLGGPCCRFVPTCSEYAILALRCHGARHGSWLAARRLCRCHPWSAGGHDPVPGVAVG